MARTGSADGVNITRRRRGLGSSMSRRTLLYAIPALAFYLFAVLVPTTQGATYAFTDWNGLSKSFSFVGFENIVDVLSDPTSFKALTNTLVIAVVFTVVQNIIGLALALGVNSKIKSRNVLKVLIFAPAVMTPVVIGYLWQYMLAPEGPVNNALDGLGLGNLKQVWLGEPNLALGSIIFVLIWQFSGYSMVIFLAGLQGVPEELIEASAVDGAGPFRRFWSIVLPLLAPAVTINVMLSMIGALKIFDQVWILTGGGPGGTTHTLSTLMFREAFTYGDFGKSIALGLVLLIIVAAISLVQYRALITREGRN
ncbi:sugar ABC transporter permease [Leifsonia sp. H3M29-4]|uniref:carbohydrate ABC transporter permease n=1 Tax=Salinibacterium metalliresistens TaxID=3031321 RepID=UPI0023DB8369|nr:sugar ABC transporter permease [Salinibacterium metalliresistens]MDF1478601.1 sugar ABC transporter permease [Salinibacterium metalliresistens]